MKQRVVMCTIKQQRNKEVSAIFLYRMLDVKLRQMIAIHSHPTKQPNTHLIKCGVATAATPAYNTINNPINYHLINLHSMSRTMQHLKFRYFSVVLFYT